jgi:hypothetical protein
VSAVVFALGLGSNPEMKRSEMAWIAWHTTSVTCSKNLISLEFFGVLFVSRQKVSRVWGATPRKKIIIFLVTFCLSKK